MVDLNHVALFANFVEAGSFAAAARLLGTPKATVSRNLARLEEDLGARRAQRDRDVVRIPKLTTVLERYDQARHSALAAAERDPSPG